jgi:hypothetical protein
MTHQQQLECAPSDSAREGAVVHIEQLMAELADKSGDFEDLMQEHLESAQFYLLNSMPEEYSVTLELAREILPDIEDDTLGKRIADFLQAQPGRRESKRGRG